ncbi:TonB-dependent siderophore receptor [Halarcobacter mediterraneus]|uniref:TonB-dependent siderophore receptor n=1 Tax=Halarcobacter mediterraneus TaxID=2023153 RepID=A0A4Q1B412_9BACT|nr:TonB-dependent siderophore receptor [Halarcobacter mediterraneus]RXK12798.1 TonB-dependent siderophore receptor [Halarcobacter mediterraneus]
MQKKVFSIVAASFILFPNIVFSAQTKTNDTVSLAEVTIVSDGSEENEQSYYKTNSTSVTRTDTPLLETAQSVQVLTGQVLDDLNLVTLDNTLDYVSGISRQNNFGGMWDNFSIRGFSGHENSGISLLKNGFADNRGYNAPRDTANIESIEFLKGPSGSLYGNTEPGGTINIVTKQPKFITENSIETMLGSEDFYRVSADVTGPLSESFAYRLNVAAEKKKSFRDYIESERYVIAPSFLWELNDKTYLTYNGEFIRQEAPLDRGIVAINENVEAIDSKTFFGNPNDGNMILENYTHQLKLEHEFSDNWSAKIGLAYKTGAFKGTGSEVKPFVNVTTDSVTLRSRYRDYDSEDISFQADIKNVSNIGNFQNTLLFGVESYRYELDSLMYTLNNSVRIDNIYNNPIYTTLATGRGTLSTNKYEEQKGMAFFAQDELAFSDSWRLLLGLRYDEIDMDSIDYRRNTTTSQNNYALSPRIGITYLINSSWSWYATSGKSFRPNSGVDINGETFDAEEGLSIETGLKFESYDKEIGGTLALYRIDKENVLTGSDPDGTYSVAAGEVRSQGIEFDIGGRLTSNLKLNANYTYTDTEVTKDMGGAVDWWTGTVVNLEGKELSNIPKHSAGVLLMWEDTLANNGSYGIGSNILYVGKRQGNYINSFTLPDYVTVGLTSYWQANENLKFKLNIDNIFDEDYIASSYDRSWVTPGSPRSFTLSMTYKF